MRSHRLWSLSPLPPSLPLQGSLKLTWRSGRMYVFTWLDLGLGGRAGLLRILLLVFVKGLGPALRKGLHHHHHHSCPSVHK